MDAFHNNGLLTVRYTVIIFRNIELKLLSVNYTLLLCHFRTPFVTTSPSTASSSVYKMKGLENRRGGLSIMKRSQESHPGGALQAWTIRLSFPEHGAKPMQQTKRFVLHICICANLCHSLRSCHLLVCLRVATEFIFCGECCF